jgi:hypothetical protein
MERPESKERERKWSRNAGADTAPRRSNLADLWLGDTGRLFADKAYVYIYICVCVYVPRFVLDMNSRIFVPT